MITSNEKKTKYKILDDAAIMAADSILAKDQRVELIPTKDGVRVIHVKRLEVKAK